MPRPRSTWGLVSRVVAPDDLLPAARDLAARIAANPPHVLRMTKSLLQQAQQLSLDAVLELSAGMQALAHHTSDHHEAVAALLDEATAGVHGRLMAVEFVVAGEALVDLVESAAQSRHVPGASRR